MADVAWLRLQRFQPAREAFEDHQIIELVKRFSVEVAARHFIVALAPDDELVAENPYLQQAVRPLLAVREKVSREIAGLDRKLLSLTRGHQDSRRLMTVPGIGPITALAFCAAIDDPARFRRSRSVGAYFGLTPRRHASGEVDWSGRISKCGDTMVRSYLFEAAGVLLTRVPQWCALKAWGLRLAKRISLMMRRRHDDSNQPERGGTGD